MSDKVAVVTGAGSGLGKALSLRLARDHRMVLTDIDEVALQNTLRAIRDAGGRGEVHTVSVTDAEAWEGLRDHVYAQFGRCDVLVNNAGVALGAAVGEAALDDVHWLLDINLWGPIYGCHFFAQNMKAAGTGHIVNIASAAAFACPPGTAAYNVSKAGVVALSDTLRAEMHGTGVNVTVVCPGFFKSGIGRAMRAVDASVVDMTVSLLERAKVDSDDVADAVLQAMARKQAYCVVKPEGKLFFVLRRAFPELVNRIGAVVANRMMK